MASEFLVYLRLGFEHIADLRGYDHIIFIVALTAMYPPRAWKRVLILVTAFTVGHSITLALATLDLIRIDSDLVEFLIPVTILATAVLNVAEAMWPGTEDDDPEPSGGRLTKYALALAFGLIHGMGFSNFLRAVLGGEESITLPLFAFNVGLEVGQIVIVGAVMVVTGVATQVLSVPWRRWTLTLSAGAGIVALYLVAVRLPF